MKKKIITYLLVSILIAGEGFCMPMSIGAAEQDKKGIQYISNYSRGADVYADVIVKKYRIYHGRQQYRRWNETRGKWVDPAWINI